MTLAPPMLAGGLEYALRTATLPGILVVIVLLILSSFSWAVMITKILALKRSQEASAEFLTRFRQMETPLELYQLGARLQDCPLSDIYRMGSRELALQLIGRTEVDENFSDEIAESGKLAPAQMESVHLALQRGVGEAALRLESQMGWLATVVSGGPFLGLLGTVWGVMDTFSGIAVAQAATSIKEMAPGVAAALVTTVIGLLVAIPAMFGYNYLVTRTKAEMVALDNFAAEVAAWFSRAWVDVRIGGTAPRPLELRPSAIAALAKAPAEPTETSPAPPSAKSPPTTSKSKSEKPRHPPVDEESGFSED